METTTPTTVEAQGAKTEEKNTTTTEAQEAKTERVTSKLTILKSLNGNIKKLKANKWNEDDVKKLTEIAERVRKEVLKEI